MKDKKILKVLLVFFVIFSILMNSSAPVLATTIDAVSNSHDENKNKQETVSEENVINSEVENNENKEEAEQVEDINQSNLKAESKIEDQNENLNNSTNVEETLAEKSKVIRKLNTRYTSTDGNTYEVPSELEKIDMALHHLNYLKEFKNDKVAALEIRNHIAWYLKGLKGSNEIKNIIFKTTNINDIISILENYKLDIIKEEL